MGIILAIDQGTTGTTVCITDSKSFAPIAKANMEFEQIFPRPGLVEHNLNDIWKTVETLTDKLLKEQQIDPSQIQCIGLTNQRETTCAFNQAGEALHNAIVWQDKRTADFCIDLGKDESQVKKVKKKTGLPIDPYFSATKMNWLLSHSDKVKSAADSHDLHFGTIDTYLLFKLTGGESFKTDASNASRTLLYNLETNDWDSELLEIFSVSKDYLPEVNDSFGEFGKTKGLSFLPDGIPITGILGDQQSALMGQAGVNKGDVKCTYGTGAFMLLNTGEEIKYSESGLLTTVGYRYQGKTSYCLEGSSFIAGAAVQWLRDGLKMISSASEIEGLAKEVSNMDEMENVLFLPFFTGIGSPYWVSSATGSILGLTRDTNKSHIARACLEGIALSINDLIKAMKKDAIIEIEQLAVDGGAVSNDLLMNIQASVSDLRIIRPKNIETTAYGATLASAIGLGLINIENVKDYWAKDAEFLKEENKHNYFELKSKKWDTAINRLYL
jgi:glycerol kinase